MMVLTLNILLASMCCRQSGGSPLRGSWLDWGEGFGYRRQATKSFLHALLRPCFIGELRWVAVENG